MGVSVNNVLRMMLSDYMLPLANERIRSYSYSIGEYRMINMRMYEHKKIKHETQISHEIRMKQ